MWDTGRFFAVLDPDASVQIMDPDTSHMWKSETPGTSAMVKVGSVTDHIQSVFGVDVTVWITSPIRRASFRRELRGRM